jgi:hypothetical protein
VLSNKPRFHPRAPLRDEPFPHFERCVNRVTIVRARLLWRSRRNTSKGSSTSHFSTQLNEEVPQEIPRRLLQLQSQEDQGTPFLIKEQSGARPRHSMSVISPIKASYPTRNRLVLTTYLYSVRKLVQAVKTVQSRSSSASTRRKRINMSNGVPTTPLVQSPSRHLRYSSP